MTLLIPATSQAIRQAPPSVLLATRLRQETAELHTEIEKVVNLPHSIRNLSDYAKCLSRFYGLYRPLERKLAVFKDWPKAGIDLNQRMKAARLAMDLTVLGVSPQSLEEAPESILPDLDEFSRALGAMYVLEGSTLGAQHILRHVNAVLGEQIGSANRFLQGHGAKTGLRWQSFCSSLNKYGMEHPEDVALVIAGATATFQAFGSWMRD
jgi:heme oxygenase